MATEPVLSHQGPTAGTATAPPCDPDGDADYWHSLIDERAAAGFLKLTDRTMQGYRYRGDGPKYIALSHRCIRYRRIDLRGWAEERLRSSTSDTGKAA